MGGNALKKFGVSRVNSSELAMVVEIVGGFLNDLEIFWAVPAAILSKKDHGDLDIIVVNTSREEVRALMKTFDSITNGPVDSVAWPMSDGRQLQIDFIYVNAVHFEYAINYFCFNDLGNLVGRFAHKMGLKHGHDGLTYIIRDGDTVVGEIVLTTDFKRAMEFLGFDHSRYLEGFDTLQEIYEYVAHHPKFSPKMFDLNERNHTARMRDRKRPTYTGFLDWINKNIGYLGDYSWPLDKSVWLSTIFTEFPEHQTTYDALWDAHNAKVSAKAKFNGVMVGQLTGLKEKPLGRLIQAFKEAHPDWVAYVNNTEQNVIDQEVVSLYNHLFGDKNERN